MKYMKKYDVDILDISYEGAGVAKIDGRVVFVPKALPGEKVKIEIVKENSNFLIGKVCEVISKRPVRIQSFCPYFEICGGCDFQHCTREEEQRLKKLILQRELLKVGFDKDVDFIFGEDRFFYRNKLKLEVEENKLGYFKVKSHDFFEIKTCPIACERIQKALPSVENFIKENQFAGLKNVYFKEVRNNLGICFLFGKHVKMPKNVLDLSVLANFSVFFAAGDVLESDFIQMFPINEKAKAGEISAEEMKAFTQVNNQVAGLLYDYIIGLTSGKKIVNAYSGQGKLTCLLAEKANFVFGIEYQKSAHESAEKLKEMDVNRGKIENICGKVEEKLQGVLEKKTVDCIVLDPARNGCEKSVLNEIINRKISSVIYVSCNFATLVRDLKILTEKYEIQSVKIFDMFPCTANMETVVVMGRK